MLEALGRREEAIRLFRQALELFGEPPHGGMARSFRAYLRRIGRIEEARHFPPPDGAALKAVALRPGATASDLFSHGWFLLLAESPELRDPAAGLRIVGLACAQLPSGGRKHLGVLKTLMVAYYANGQTARALDVARGALAQLPFPIGNIPDDAITRRLQRWMREG